jgi:phospholipase/carboxylesterase
MLGNACRVGDNSKSRNGRIEQRPRGDAKPNPQGGEIVLGSDGPRDSLLHLPKNPEERRLPLLVMLHGATQSAGDMFGYLEPHLETSGVAVLAPNSQGTTWDAVRDKFGPDIEYLNRTLERVFQMVAIDPERISVGGFSDGASYAISLGLINGDLFSRVAAFSPGFVVNGKPQGSPRFFISHGTHDHILPIDRCGRLIASELKELGYQVNFREFDGDHEIPGDVAREGLEFVK